MAKLGIAIIGNRIMHKLDPINEDAPKNERKGWDQTGAIKCDQ